MLLGATVMLTFASHASAAVTPVAHGHGSWRASCPSTHRAPDDPIVFPGEPGRAHMHDFFGNPTTDAFSTPRTLRAAAPSCTRAPDRSAYWVPTLYALDPLGVAEPRVVAPRRSTVYYLAGNRKPRTIRPFPRGLRVVAGDSHADAAQRAPRIVWYCSRVDAPAQPLSPAPPSCGQAQELYARVLFPECSNGDKDSSNHQSHMAYATRAEGRRFRVCPASHPIPVPLVRITIEYPPQSTNALALSSGGRYSLHADFFEAWRRAAVRRLIRKCIAADLDCGNRGSP